MRYNDKSIKIYYFSDNEERKFSLVLMWLLKHIDSFNLVIDDEKKDEGVNTTRSVLLFVKNFFHI